MSSDDTVYLVSCVGKKQDMAMPAKNLYVSQWFLRARRYVEATGCRWFILSAKYGLVAPDQTLSPYEQTLNTMGIVDRRHWAYHVQTQMDHQLEQLPHTKRIVVLAGIHYREFLLEYFHHRGIAVEIPLEGLGIGEQLSWLGRHLPTTSSDDEVREI